MINSSHRSLFATASLLLLAGMAGSGLATAQTPPWVALPDGQLDPRFGNAGMVTTRGSVPLAALRSAGKIVVASYGVLARYNVDGSLDDTFGSGGTVTNTLGGYGSLVLQADGKLLTFGNSAPGLLLRFNSDGSPDTGFGGGGGITMSWSSGGIAVQPDGRIVVSGRVGEGGRDRIVVARYHHDGTPDQTFGSGGSAILQTGEVTGAASTILIQPDRKIVLVGTGLGPFSGGRGDFLVLRVNEDATLDPGFGNNGVVIRDVNGRIDRGVTGLLLPDGRILAGGEGSTSRRSSLPSDFTLMSFLPNGGRDTSFGSSGLVRTLIQAGPVGDSQSGIGALVLQPDGKIVAAGRMQPFMPYPGGGGYTVSDFAMVRYHPDGSIDESFGVGGVVVTDVGKQAEWASDLLLQPDGQLVAAIQGESSTGPDGCNCRGFPLLARYRNDSARGVFGAATRPVPAHIEAEDYDLGGQGTGYSDTTPGNEGGRFVYRTDEVDIKGSSEGGHAIGWFTAGEWLAYTIDVPRAGVYTVAAQVGSALPGRTFHFAVDGTDVTGPIAVPNVGAWDTYGTTRRQITLSAGRHVLRVVMGPADFMEFQSLDITEGGTREIRSGNDFDGDGRTDLAVFRPGNGSWYVNNGATSLGTFGWGLPGDVPLAGDFDGDGRTDLTVWRPSTGTWYIRESSSGYSEAGARAIQWGLPGDVPLTADFDGDGQSDLTVFRPSVGMWYPRYSSRGYAVADADAYQWGLPGDLPVAADFDGDGRSELTVFRPSVGTWCVRYSSRAYATADAAALQWGLPGDVPLSADFDGDGLSELTVFRPSVGTWYVRYSSRGYAVAEAGAAQWGLPGDVPISGDFDGDGRTDLTVYRPASGQWYLRASTLEYDPARAAVYQWGLAGDIPVQ